MMREYNTDFEQFCVQAMELYRNFRHQIWGMGAIYVELILFIQFFSKYSGAPSQDVLLLFIIGNTFVVFYVLCLILNHILNLKQFIGKRIIFIFDVFLFLTIAGIIISNFIGRFILDYEMLDFIRENYLFGDDTESKFFWGIEPKDYTL